MRERVRAHRLTQRGLEPGECVGFKDGPLLPDGDDTTHGLQEPFFLHSGYQHHIVQCACEAADHMQGSMYDIHVHVHVHNT